MIMGPVFDRKEAISLLDAYRGNGIIKAITGIRRCGKSFLLFELYKKHLIEDGVSSSSFVEIHLDRKSFSYYRFATHVKYLLERKMENKTISTDNRVMMDQMVEQFPQAYRCVLVMKQYLKETMQWEISEEEQLYLMLHINRMKEDCNLK